MTDRQAAAGFCLILICFTVWLCFRGIAWVVRNGWRSMLGLVALRGEGVVTWQDCDVKTEPDWPDSERWRQHVDRASAIADEPSPLLREIYAAQLLARDGVDVEKGAPKEMAP